MKSPMRSDRRPRREPLPARLTRYAAALAATAGLAGLALWTIGLIFSDRYYATQYLWWIPTLFVLAGALAAAAASWILDRLARLLGARKCPSRLRALLALGCIACAFYYGAVDLRLHGYALEPAPAPEHRTLHLVHWNLTAAHPRRWERYKDIIDDGDPPDVLLLTNPVWSRQLFDQLAERFGPEYTTLRSGNLGVITRVPILRHRGTSLGIEGWDHFRNGETPIPTHDEPAASPRANPLAVRPSDPGWYDPGYALLVEFDTTEILGKPTVIWFLDLPSDVRLPRRLVAQRALDRIDEMGGLDEWPPAIVAGDFNITRGSYTLSMLAPGMTHAYNHAGAGDASTWPAGRFPIVHIDHILLAPWLRSTAYRVEDRGLGSHLLQDARIAPADLD